MKIVVLAISRGRPAPLTATLISLQRLESGTNETAYFVRCDADDEPTMWAAREAGAIPIIGSRPETLGAALNAAVRELPPDWEVLQIVPDDIQPLARAWDYIVSQSAKVNAAASWQELADPANPTLPYITREWHDAVGAAMPEWFPFWFSDVWIGEVFSFVYNRPMPILSQLPWAAAARGRTRNMHDLLFWCQFYAATRKLRLLEAAKLRKECFDLMPWVRQFEATDAWRYQNAARLEAALGDKAPPTAAYHAAKARAEQWLKENPDASRGNKV